MTASIFQKCCLPLWINTFKHATHRKAKKVAQSNLNLWHFNSRSVNRPPCCFLWNASSFPMHHNSRVLTKLVLGSGHILPEWFVPTSYRYSRRDPLFSTGSAQCSPSPHRTGHRRGGGSGTVPSLAPQSRRSCRVRWQVWWRMISLTSLPDSIRCVYTLMLPGKMTSDPSRWAPTVEVSSDRAAMNEW